MDDSITKSEREMLKAIHRMSQGHAEDAAHTGHLADRLGLSPSTVTTVVKRLADRGLADHRPYHGVVLTARGSAVADAAVRRHRIVERFLADMLGVPGPQTGEMAEAFEHELPREVEQRLFAALGEPNTCPHGHPIPAPTAIPVRRNEWKPSPTSPW